MNQERQPAGITYKVFRLADTTSFIHVMIADLDDRSADPPVTTSATIVGGYR